MNGYLIDTDICIYFIKGKYRLDEKFDLVPEDRLYISEITVAELKFGAAKSAYPEKNRNVLENFFTGVQILPIFDALDIFAEEKARLQRQGTSVDDFDLLIGTTAVFHNMTLVTHNTRHFERIKGIHIEDWTG